MLQRSGLGQDTYLPPGVFAHAEAIETAAAQTALAGTLENSMLCLSFAGLRPASPSLVLVVVRDLLGF
jgi:hypothetical protein